MTIKICKTCKQEKELQFFPPRSDVKSGYRAECKQCVNIAFNIRRSRNNETYKERDRRYYMNHKKEKVSRVKNYELIYPERKKARIKVRQALLEGEIKKELCFCGKEAEAHHPNYNKPLTIQWLCRSHHKKLHIDMEI